MGLCAVTANKVSLCFSQRGTGVGVGIVSLTIRYLGSLFVNQHSVTITEYLRESAYKEKRSTLAHRLRVFNPWSFGSVALGPAVMQKMDSVADGGAKLLTSLQAGSRNRKAWHPSIPSTGIPQ
jgi:hypothetical protein